MAVDSGRVNTNRVSSENRTRFYVLWEQKSRDIPNNRTTISWTVYLENYWEYYQNAVRVTSLIIDGNTVYSGGVWSNITTEGNHELASGTTTIAHNTDGSKTFSIVLNGWLFSNTTLTGSGSFTLATIPREASVAHELSSRTETSLTIQWTSDSICDQAWYRRSNGSGWTSWTTISQSDSTGGSYTISGLSAGTTYEVETRVRRKDSQITTTSDALSAKTYPYPYAISTPDFDIGSELIIKITNPLSRTVTVSLLYGSTVIKSYSTSGYTVKGFKDDDTVNALYSKIPNAVSGDYKVSVTYGSHTTTTDGGTFTALESRCGPSIGALSYEDTVSQAQAIVQDTSVLVQNKSRPLFTVVGLTTRKSASITKVVLRLNGTSFNMTVSGSSATHTTGLINSASNLTATATITDSRGFTATSSCSVKMAAWADPVSSATIQRQNNFYATTYLTIKASGSSLNSHNELDISYVASAVGETDITETIHISSSSGTINRQLTCNNNKSWNFTITVTDALGKTFTYIQKLSRGIPLMFWDRVKNFVGINRYPTLHNLEVLEDVAVVGAEGYGYNTSLVSNGTFDSVGWYTVLEFSSSTDNRLYGIYPMMIDIYMGRSYTTGNNEAHSVLMTMTYNNVYWTRETSVSNARTYLTNVRWVYSTSSHIAKLQVYYDSTNSNTCVFTFHVTSRLGAFTAPTPYFDNSFSGTVLSTHTFDTGSYGLLPLSQVNWSGKLERTGDYEFFTVTVNRPLAFGSETTQNTTHEVECVLRLPESYSPTGTPTRLVLACHGASGYIRASTSTWYNNDGWKPFMDEILAAGYAVFDSNVLPNSYDTDQRGLAWGSPLYVNVLKAAYDYIQKNYNVYPEIFAHGTSMGGVGASAFTNTYPHIVLAQSSFAGRNIMQWIRNNQDGPTNDRPIETMNKFAISWGYASYSALTSNKWSYVEGITCDLSLVKYDSSGRAQTPPLRQSDYDNWLTYYSQIIRCSRNQDAGIWMGHRTVPYKAWNSWADDEYCTKLETVLQEAYRRGNSVPYILVNKESGSHSEISYGRATGMRSSLIAWFRRYEGR